MLPMRAENGQVIGAYDRVRETTKEGVRERRSDTLYAISAPPRDTNVSVWDHVFQALGANEQDFPMAFAYSAEDDSSTWILSFQQSLGLAPVGHPLVPRRVNIYERLPGFPFYYRKAKTANKPIVIHKADNILVVPLKIDMNFLFLISSIPMIANSGWDFGRYWWRAIRKLNKSSA